MAYTNEPVEPGKVSSLPPEFCRPADCRRLFGLTRTFVYELIKVRKIKSFCLRKPGKRTGIRLVYVESVREFLRSEMEKAE